MRSGPHAPRLASPSQGRPPRRHRPPRRRRIAGALLGILAAVLVPAVVAAHPLGNFTINHYAGVRVEPGRILLDVVIDQAEIPTFQARLDFDTDADGDVSDDEIDAGRIAACDGLVPALALSLDGAGEALTLRQAGLSFPPGIGGLSTMRVVCGFEASPGDRLAAGTRVEFADGSFPDRLGWREIVVEGSGVTLDAGAASLRSASPSDRLTHYPTNLLAQALDDEAVSFRVLPGGPTLAPFAIHDASPVEPEVAAATADPAAAQGGATAPPGESTPAGVPATAGFVPGGVSGGDLPSIFRSADLTPLVLLVSVLTAVALGAGHALTPGHGKTLMAAYLVGSRGTPLHAAGLGLSVTLSHTLGILGLAALVIGAQGILPADLVVRVAPVVAAVSIVLIGGWMLYGEGRRRWRRRVATASQGRDVGHDHGHGEGAHDHGHGPSHDDGHGHGDGAHARAHGGQDPNAHAHAHATDHDHDPAAEHAHGGVRHSHLPDAGGTITWRSLFVLGLAGGLIPSTSALLILLGSIAAGRPAFGFVLVVAFGLGMALVMSGIGLVLVVARGRLDRVDAGSRLGRLSASVPLVAALLVFSLGIYLTVQAVAGSPVF